MTDTPQVLLAHHLKTLKLPTFLREYDKIARQCASEGVDHVRYLLRLAELELIDRERRMVERLSLPFISSAVETLEFCIPTGYLFRHAQDHQHAHLRLPRNRPWPRSALHRNPCPATAGSCPETEKAPAIASEGG